MTTITAEQAAAIVRGPRVPRRPRWRFDGYYARYAPSRGGKAWPWNEGEFPNFCLPWHPRRLDFIYVALAPRLRFWWTRKPYRVENERKEISAATSEIKGLPRNNPEMEISMFQYGGHHGPNIRALFDELKRRGLAYDEMPIRENKDGAECGFMAIAEKTSGYTAKPTDGPEEAAAGDGFAGLGVPSPTS